MSKGIIYVCSTAVDGLIKIGRTTDFEKRVKILEDNGYRNVAGLTREFAIEVENHEEIEQLLGDLFEKSRVGNTELFSLDLNKIIQLLSSFSGRQIYPKNETKEEVFHKASEMVQSKFIPNGEYFLDVKMNGIENNIKAKMSIIDNKFILKKGSTIVLHKVYDRSSIKQKRSEMFISKDGILQEDFECNSPSTAATLVMGRPTNGWITWKNREKRIINIYRKKYHSED